MTPDIALGSGDERPSPTSSSNLPASPAETPPPAPPAAGDGPGTPGDGGFEVMAVLKEAFGIVRGHRALWVFGVLLALTGGTSSYQWNFNMPSGGFPDFGSGMTFPDLAPTPGQIPEELDLSELEAMGEQLAQRLSWADIGPLLALVCGALMLLALVAIVVRYVSRVALMGMVTLIDRGERPSVRQGFHMGWSGRAFRLWGLELLVLIAVVLAGLGLSIVVGGSLLVLMSSGTANAIKVFAGVLAFLLLIPAIIVVSVGLTILAQLWSREIAVAGHRIDEAFSRAWNGLRSQWRAVGLLWIALVGVAIAVGIGLAIVGTLLAVPVLAVTFGVWAATQSMGPTFAVLVVSGLLAMAPLLVAVGLVQAFMSACWTIGWLRLPMGRSVAMSRP